MRPPRRFTTEAIVIRHFDYGEADRILTLYSPDYGKIHAIAKGIRRGRSRMAGHLDLFTRASVFVSQGRNLDIVSQAQAIEHFSGLRTNLQAANYAHYTAELLDSFVPDRLPNPQIYELQIQTLRTLNQNPLALHVRWFELVLLDHSGYRLELRLCLGCSNPVLPEANWFSSGLGGILCPKCASNDEGAMVISVAALKLLRNLQTSPQQVLRLESIDLRVGREIESRIRESIIYRLEKRPKSISVLERMSSRPAAIR